jgi:hypothetical protein
MSARTRSFFEALKEGATNAMQEIGEEMQRLAVQGQAELAGALFNGNAYVPYGRGQDTKLFGNDGEDLQPRVEAPQVELPQQEQERGGMEM